MVPPRRASARNSSSTGPDQTECTSTRAPACIASLASHNPVACTMSGSPTLRASSPAACTSAETRAVSGGWGGMMYHTLTAAAPQALWEAKDAMQAGARVLVHSVWSGPVDAEFLTLARRGGTIYVPTLSVPDGYRQVAARRFERDLQPLACVDPATRAKALATDTVAPAQRPSDSAVAERTARTARTLAQGLANLKRVYDAGIPVRSEEHTSELQSHHDLVCR